MENIAENLAKRYNMEMHMENGSYLERHYVSDIPGRPASGSIYYYVSPNEITKFHTIDCDEYWIYVVGSPLEICSVDENGNISYVTIGTKDGCVPFAYIKKGVCFASRHPKKEEDGTFIVCITVPRFSDDGFKMFEDSEMIKKYPSLKNFLSLPNKNE